MSVTAGSRSDLRRASAALAACVAALAMACAVLAGEAAASAPIKSFETRLTSTQAGGHPDLLIPIELTVPQDTPLVRCNCNQTRDLTVNTPPGFVGIPRNVPRCTDAEFATLKCPVESQVGVTFAFIEAGISFVIATYNMVPRPDQAGLVAFERPFSEGEPIYTSFTVRTESDYGLEAKTFGVPAGFPPRKIAAIFWGVPGDPVHDALRAPPPPNGWAKPSLPNAKFTACLGLDLTEELFNHEFTCLPPEMSAPTLTPFNGPADPFLSSPTRCSGPLVSTLDNLAYDLGTDHAEAPFPAMTGCDQLAFDPTLSAKPTTTEADSPSGLDVELTVPQSAGPNSPARSQIRSLALSLPEGIAVNPNAANGKVSCSDAQARFGTREEAQCPEHAKIGTLEIESTALPGSLPGALYLGEPLPGSRYRVFLTADGFSLHIKLAGIATPDPETGQLTVSFKDLPQAPFQRFDLHVFGAERGLLATPSRCGTYPVKTTFTPWAEELPEQTSTQFFTIESGPGGSPCPGTERPFDPAFSAGSADNAAGIHSPFTVSLTRPDGDQNLSALTVRTPPGFSGTLKGIPYCPEAALAQLGSSLYSGLTEMASPACPAASQIGVVTAGAGAGSRPLYAPGKVYLTGPYKGAPLGLVVVIPAVSGPYDLGNVAVRAGFHVDPTNAQVTTVSDPLPRIVEGIPLRTRSILVNLNREGFTRNPTNCDPRAVDAQISGTGGASVTRSSHYQVANCSILPFEPKLKLRLRGGTKRAAHPALRATLTAKPGESNISRTVVALPRTVLLDNAHIGTSCTRVQFAANACPRASIYGHARAFTPQLEEPLEGPVYLRASNNKLPDLVAALKGQIEIELVGRIDSINGGIRTTFEGIPDASVSRFELNMKGGDKGLLFNGVDICRVRKTAAVTMVGQNGRRATAQAPLNPSCGKARKAKRGQSRLYRSEAVR